MEKDPFKEYIKQSEPGKRDKGYAWHTAIGLQAVDGLTPSEYLVETAIQNIEGKITIDQAQQLLDSYYEQNSKDGTEDRTEEADKVSVRIARLLSENAFSFSPAQYISIHKKLFEGIYSHAGEMREYNITKKEWVLDGATVMYGSASELRAMLEYDFSQEKNFSYKGLSMEEHNELHNRSMHISGAWHDLMKQDIDSEKQDIDPTKQDIDFSCAFTPTLEKVNFSKRTLKNTEKLYAEYGSEKIFGRSDIMNTLGITASPASELIKKLLALDIIVPVSGMGKGKYTFSHPAST